MALAEDPRPVVRVRAVREDELVVVGELTVEAYLTDGHVTADSSYLPHLADAASRVEHAEVLVAVDERDTPVGSVTVALPGSRYAELCQEGEVEFRMLAVHPEARGRGIGELLTRAVLDRAREIGARRVVMCSGTDMTAAHRIYTRVGFTRLPERDWEPVPGMWLLAFAIDVNG